MSISVIVNTCALGPRASEIRGSAGKTVPHTTRIYALRNFILPRLKSDPAIDELLVVGEWEPGPGYRYLHVPTVAGDCTDALAQRHAGFCASRGSTVVFQHDDHILDWDFFTKSHPGWEVLSPLRLTRLRSSKPERVNSGRPGDPWTPASGLILGHAAVYRRRVIECCPWDEVPKVFAWDASHTAQIRASGFRVSYPEDLKVFDVEMTT